MATLEDRGLRDREAGVQEWGETSVPVLVLCNYLMDIYYIVHRPI